MADQSYINQQSYISSKLDSFIFCKVKQTCEQAEERVQYFAKMQGFVLM